MELSLREAERLGCENEYRGRRFSSVDIRLDVCYFGVIGIGMACRRGEGDHFRPAAEEDANGP
jgi:hypothetical protein